MLPSLTLKCGFVTARVAITKNMSNVCTEDLLHVLAIARVVDEYIEKEMYRKNKATRTTGDHVYAVAAFLGDKEISLRNSYDDSIMHTDYSRPYKERREGLLSVSVALRSPFLSMSAAEILALEDSEVDGKTFLVLPEEASVAALNRIFVAKGHNGLKKKFIDAILKDLELPLPRLRACIDPVTLDIFAEQEKAKIAHTVARNVVHGTERLMPSLEKALRVSAEIAQTEPGKSAVSAQWAQEMESAIKSFEALQLNLERLRDLERIEGERVNEAQKQTKAKIEEVLYEDV